MMWLFAVLIVLALGGIAVVAAGRGGSLPEAYPDRPDVPVPQGPLTGADLRRVRFSLAVRGYRMDEVDALLSRLADQLEAGTEDRAAAEAGVEDAIPDPGPTQARGDEAED